MATKQPEHITQCEFQRPDEHMLIGPFSLIVQCCLQGDGRESAIDVEDLPSDSAGQVAEQKNGGIADFTSLDIASQWCTFGNDIQDLSKSTDGHCRHGSERAAGNRVAPDVGGTKFRREVSGR
jgi:hypothetical protein